MNRNNVWVVGEVAVHLFSAGCQNALGATQGTIAGVLAAEKASEEQMMSKIVDFVEHDLPQILLPEPLMSLAANGYLKFRELSAGHEL